MPQKDKENKQEDTQLPDDNIVTKQMPSVCSKAPQNPPVHVCVCALSVCVPQRLVVHACECAARLPHLAAIRMCASVTAVKQHKCVAQMERRGWRTELVL